MAKSTKGGQRVVNPVQQEAPSDGQRALTIVEQGPRSDISRVDGYGGLVEPSGTSYYNNVSNYMDDFFKSFTSKNGLIPDLGGFNLTSLSGLKDAFNKIKSINPSELKKRFETSVLGGRSVESIMALPKAIKNNPFGTLSKELGGVNLGGFDVGKFVKDAGMSYREAMGMYNLVKNNDWSSFAGIVNGLNAIGAAQLNSPLGNIVNGFADITATSAFLGSLAREAVRLGNQPLVNEVMKYFKDRREGKRYLNTAMYGAAVASDMANMDFILDYCGTDETLSNNPILIRWVLQHYQLDGLYNSNQLPQYRERLINLLNKIDPAWYYTEHAGQRVTKLDPFVWASQDALRLLRYNTGESDPYFFTTEIMIAKTYPERDLKQLIMSQYKDIAYKDRPRDPRMRR